MSSRHKTMNRRRAMREPTGFWGTRVDALIRACGWKCAEFRKYFGRAAWNVTKIRYHGARPQKARDFALAAAKAGAVHAPELEALAQGLIQVRGRVRYDWRRDEQKGLLRQPADLRDLG